MLWLPTLQKLAEKLGSVEAAEEVMNQLEETGGGIEGLLEEGVLTQEELQVCGMWCGVLYVVCCVKCSRGTKGCVAWTCA